MNRYAQLSTAILVLLFTASAFAGVTVSSPANDATVGSSVMFVASATTSCSKGVASMGIYPAAYQLAYTVNGDKLDTSLNFNPGTYDVTVQEWDNCGGSTKSMVKITVSSSGSTAKTLYNIHKSGGWQGYGQQSPSYADCNPCSGTTWSMHQGITSPTLSGSSTQFKIGGTKPYSDVLWLNRLIGTASTQGLPDTSKTLVPTLHNFTYDIYFFGSNLLAASGALEFDINQYFNNMGFIWGLECRMWTHQWALWDSYNKKWTSTSMPCNPKSNAWNHLVYTVERTSSNQLLYKSITLNGVTQAVNKTFNHFSVSGWYGVVVNYQMDGNYTQESYTTYVDKLNFTYE